MIGRRLIYLAALEICLVFFLAYREWLSGVILVAVAALPWFGLLLSLPAMLTAKVRLQAPAQLTAGTPAQPQLNIACPLPAPPVRCRLEVRHSISGRTRVCEPDEPIPTRHCGLLEIQKKRLWIYDYLGLLRLPGKKDEPRRITVLPKPLPLATPLPDARITGPLIPKPGAFSEIHDLRLYRPGDDLRLIHWKLAAQTGKLIYLESMARRQGALHLELCLHGDAATIDRKLGRLLWVSPQLLEKGLSHRIRCMTGRGLEEFVVSDQEGLYAALEAILAAPAAPKEAALPQANALWQYRIGGEPDEA